MGIEYLYQNPEKTSAFLSSLPESPGIYKYFDDTDNVIYVGKAKNLKKRVSSYFQKTHDNARLRLLVKRIVRIETIHVDTEFDALLLENTLIKQLQPRYNIRLKDDKTYPWICFSNEYFPRIFVSRYPDFAKSTCFGPYPSHRMMYTVLELVRTIFPFRTCKLNLTQRNIAEKKFRVCLQYQIGNCKGPCEGLQDREEYMQNFEMAKDLIRGKLQGVLRMLKNSMEQHSKNLEFEQAQVVKEKIHSLEHYQSGSPLVHPSLRNCDVVSVFDNNEQSYFVNYMRVLTGRVVNSNNFILQSKLSETVQEVFDHALLQSGQLLQGFSDEVIVPFLPSTEFAGVKFVVPKTGHKKELLVLSQKNSRMFALEKKKDKQTFREQKQKNNVLEKAKADLLMNDIPAHIECFDNSNFQGDYAVAALVVFKNGKPASSQYRHFNIKTVAGPDDYASMREVVYRRYKRLLDEEQDLPQLIVIDGGKGQLESAAESLSSLGILEQVKLISIAKKLETIFHYGDNTPMFLDKKSTTLRLLQYIRNEAHRFGITHHRQKRQKEIIQTQLTAIKGIGEATATKLLRHFGSVEAVRTAEFRQIEAVVGASKAIVIMNALHPVELTHNITQKAN